MAASKDPEKHHYIPEFYLRWWTGEDGRLDRYTREYRGKMMVRRSFPSETGFVKKLYESPGENPELRNWMETALFQRIDSRAARVLVKLNSDPVPNLSIEEMSAWSIFIRSLHHRTPDGIEKFRQSGQREWLEALDKARNLYPRLRGQNDPETFEEYRKLHTSAQVDKMILRVLPSILFSERVGIFLNGLHKKVIDTWGATPEFLISDALLAMTNGLQIPGGHYAIPLSPRRIMVATHEESTLRDILNMEGKELATNMNRWAVERARHFVGARNRNQDRFIRNRFGMQMA